MQFHEKLGFKANAGIRAAIVNIRNYPYHFHQDYIELICVLKGNVEVYDAAVPYLLEEDAVHVINSTDPHKIASKEDDNLVLLIHIDQEHYTQNYEDLRSRVFIVHDDMKNFTNLPEFKLFRLLMAKVYQEYASEHPSDIMLDKLANELLALLYEHFRTYAYKIIPGGYNMFRRRYNGKNESEFYRIYQIVDYIEANYKQHIKLSDIAQREHLSTAYLSRYIKENIGITFSQLVSITRADEAARLLSNTNKGIDPIALESGFANSGHLFQHFRKWFSLSPSRYRKMVLNDLNSSFNIEYGDVEEGQARVALRRYLNG